MLNVKIENKDYSFFSSAVLNLTYDKVASTFSLSCIVDPENKELIEIYKPLGYLNIKIYVEEEIAFTGTILSHNIKRVDNNNTLTITGYSLCGKAADCEIPTEAYPLQMDGMTLRQICDKITKKLQVPLFVNQIAARGADKAYALAQGEPKDKSSAYISRLASQRNLIIGNTRLGELLITKLRLNEPYVGNYIEEQFGPTKMEATINGQVLHSRCTVLNQANENDQDRGIFQAHRSLNSFRPTVTVTRDGDNNDASTGAKAILNAEAKGIMYTMTITTHRYQDGTIMKPNRRLTLISPSVMLLEKTELFVNDVILRTDLSGDTAVLKLIPVEALQV